MSSHSNGLETSVHCISPKLKLTLSISNADNIIIKKFVYDELEKQLTINTSIKGKEKKYKTSHDMITEHTTCDVHTTASDIFNNCLSIQRIIIILKGYYKLVTCNGLPEMTSLSEILSFNGIYTLTQMMNDFVHIKDHMEHNTENRKELIKKFRNEFKSIQCKYKRLNVSEFKDNEDNLFDQQCKKIYSYVTQLDNEMISSIKSTGKFKHYVGEREDNKWFNYTTCQTNKDIYNHLVKNMGMFQWQSPHGFNSKQYQGLMHLKPRYKNVKDEVLQNKYYPLSRENWNTTLRKATVFHSSYARQRIKTTYNGKYDDRITNEISVWRKGETINMPEIVTLKLYTDFDKLQFELKKCYRFETLSDIFMLNKTETKKHGFDVDLHDNKKQIRLLLEERLCIFYWWRIKVLSTLSKYSQPLDPKVPLYHGVNSKMILNNQRKIFGFCGPLSTSSSYHVARTFATAKGMVLEINTQFPGLGLCRAFDVSLISDYPEEKEQLLSFAYLRVTKVLTMPLHKDWKTFDDIENSDNMNTLPLSSITRSIFFSVQLFLQGIYSMSVHSEYWLSAFLYLHCGYDELEDNKDNGHIKRSKFVEQLMMSSKYKQFDVTNDLSRYNRILSILKQRFNDYRNYPNRKQVVKIDRVSDNLKPYFMNYVNMDIHAKEKYVLSISKIVKIFPNAEEIHVINPDILNNDTLTDVLVYIQKHNELKLRKIKFLCYDSSSSNHSVDIEQLLKSCDKSDKSDNIRWRIKDKHIPKIGFEITIGVVT